MKKTLSILMPISLLLTSCATIMHGTRQTVGISSNPSNAEIWVDNQYVGTTPSIVSMTRCDHHFMTIQLDGYAPYQIAFTRQLSGWVFGNIVFGGFIGVAVDAISGAIYRLTPEQVQAELQAERTYYTNTPDSFVSVVLNANPSWEKIGQLQSK